MLSATALIGLFFGFKFLITIFDRSLTIFPFHLLGLNGLIGEIDNFFEFRLNIGPWSYIKSELKKIINFTNKSI